MARVATVGKHLETGDLPFRVRGAAYGSFRRRPDGYLFPDAGRIAADLAAMADAGLNVVRTYTCPPRELMEIARDLGMRVLVGVDYRDWRYEETPDKAASKRVVDNGLRSVDEALEICVGAPEVLALSVGNEVPADVVRLHGIGRVEEGLSRLLERVKTVDPDLLATYCNFPTTEYLDPEGQDLICFNVFLEHADALKRYLQRLQVVSRDLPLVITELGLASESHGPGAQAVALDWQLEAVDEAGCAGATVFSWTDEWAVDDKPVTDWGFGLTTEARDPKPALGVVEAWAARGIEELRTEWPTVSVVVCAYNGDQLIEKCLTSLNETHYPKLEIIVCDDGSTDRTLEIAKRFPFQILELPRMGLSAARNAGIAASTGDIVAFLDADAMCHPEWPFHLALSLEQPNVVATGGPNLPVPDTDFVERAVAASPGGPVEVLVADDRAEHVPGCNMAFRREALEAIGGFDPVYTAAGDDVDVCWKILDRGYEIGFSPGAQVFHHRRDSVRRYLKQQKGYGKAEKMLAGRHRHRFNRLGQARWSGFVYGGPRFLGSMLRPVVYHGYLGLAPYQGVVKRRSETVRDWTAALLPLAAPVAAAGIALSLLNLWWLLLTAVALGAVLGYGAGIALAAQPERSEPEPLKFSLLVAWLHVAQPFVRAWGRVRNKALEPASPGTQAWAGDRLGWLRSLERELTGRGCSVTVGRATDPWDIEAGVGPLMRVRLATAVLWGWTPVARLRLHPRPYRLLACVSVTAALATLNVMASVGLAIAGATWLGFESIRALRRARAAVVATTSGAES
jgi:glycosyltransferase involved in cell wall biosynthesis